MTGGCWCPDAPPLAFFTPPGHVGESGQALRPCEGARPWQNRDPQAA